MTLETFLAWKKRKIQEKKETARKDEDKKRSDFKAGRQVGLSGREMFSFNPEMAAEFDLEEGDEAFDSTMYKSDDEDAIEYKEINLDMLDDGSEVGWTFTCWGFFGQNSCDFRLTIPAQWQLTTDLSRMMSQNPAAAQTTRMMPLLRFPLMKTYFWKRIWMA